MAQTMSGKPTGKPAERSRRLSPDGGEPDRTHWRYAVQLWLRWHHENKQLTSRLYQAGNDAATIEDLMDHLDQMRVEAAKRSEELLAEVNA